MLAVLLLGPPQVWLNQRPLPITRRKSRALLYYLAAQTTPTTRDQLLTLLWPEHDRAAAQQILRTTLHGLRKTLGPALLVAEDTLALAATADVDVRRFAAQLAAPAADRQQLADALEGYRGDFLADFVLPDAAAFDEWAAEQRERYRQLAVRGFTMLAQQHEAAQDYAGALAALVRAIVFDPLQEDVQRAALRLHYLAGDRAGAIRRYDQLRRLLIDELGVPPMAETQALYDAIITDRLERPSPARRLGDRLPERRASVSLAAGSPVAHAPQLPFVGRSAELHTLRALALAHQLALIEGEPGLGKTRLAEESIQATDALLLAGVARELEGALPYQPIIEALRSLLARPEWPALRANLHLSAVWLAELARLLPELAPTLPDPQFSLRAADESRLWEGINQFLRALARQRSVIVFLDDLHWADAATLALLGYLVRQAVTGPIFFLATMRPVAPQSPLATLLHTLTREGRLARLALPRLAPEDIAALASHLSPAQPAQLAAWLMQTSEGNPYILAELLRYAREHDLLSAQGELRIDPHATSPLVPQTVYSLIQSRLARLSDAARSVLDVAVAVGREFEFELVARAAGLSESDALDALDELRAAALIYPRDGLRHTFDHNLTMEVAYREVGELRHRLLHRRVAEAMEVVYRQRLDAVAGLLASHFAEGNAPERAAPYAFRAGQLAADLAAWKEATAFYEQALVGADEGQRGAILRALGEVRFQAGEPAQASEAFRDALALAESRGAVDAEELDASRLALARSFLMQARYADVIAMARLVLADARPASAAHAEFLWGAALSLEGADLNAAAAHLQAGAAQLHQQAAPDDPASLAQITFELGSVAAQQGDLAGAITRYREVLAIAQTASSDSALSWQILALNNLGYHLHLLDDPTAEEHARAGLRLAQEKGFIVPLPYLLSTLGEIALARGDLAAAERLFTEGLAFAAQLSLPERIAGLTANLGLVALRRQQTALALHRLSSACAQADALGNLHLAAQIRLWLAPLLPPAEAHTQLAEARAIAERGGRRRLLHMLDQLDEQLAVYADVYAAVYADPL
jgi:DNA-binding SARP family transcriptional activator